MERKNYAQKLILFFITLFLLTFSQIINSQTSFIKDEQVLGIKMGRCVASGDIDNDGDNDIIIGYLNYDVVDTNRLWINDGNGNFSLSNVFIGTNADQIELADLNGDHYPDIIYANYGIYENDNWTEMQNEVWINNKNGHFSKLDNDIGRNSGFVQIIDFNNDDFPDINIADSIWINDGNGNFTNSGIKISNPNIENFTLGDLDSDGDIDAFVVEWDFINGAPSWIYFNDGTNKFSKDPLQNFTVTQTRKVLLGDLDSDGDLDAFFVNFHSPGPVFKKDEIWKNNGNGVFTKSEFSQLQKATYDAKLIDIDKDGDLDIYTAYSGADQTSTSQYIWLNDGTGLFTDSEVRIMGTLGVSINDFNGDDKVDILVLDNSGNNLWFNNTVTGISNNNQEIDKLVIFPNPAKYSIQIDSKNLSSKLISYELIDITGEILNQGKLESEIIDISNLSKGIYLIHLKTDKEKTIKKIVIE